MTRPVLIVFAGLPGTGKTTLARRIAAEHACAYLRIDSIEQALRDASVLAGDVGPAGYVVAYALAESNLALGQSVVADAVNPVAETRAAWRRLAKAADCQIVEIELVCSDAAEHRRRIETRSIDIPGLRGPAWQDVLARDYTPWEGARLVVDTATATTDEAAATINARLAAVD